jgi:hypothetical protein
MAGVPQPPIVTCAEWGAKPARSRASLAGRPQRAIIHHTDGHHAEIANPANESRAEAIRYARDIQALHMGPSRGWNDTGQNFTVCRSGLILEGRHGSLAAARVGLAIWSAHCPGQNDQPGVEHEHVPGERMTDAQARSSVWLFAWLCDRTGRNGIRPTALYGHGAFYATECPDTIPVLWLRAQVARQLMHYGRGTPSRTAGLHSATGGRLLKL